ncbi:PREDICTED: uncharacterized protein LOC108754617 [Trachymyrmex septentrionalis]|uniref:uncharacterized protein LOC108754617 n=1 Tax=Trachymyrmex septentrionalis TaxID=34720 RepID=UPI00084EDB73|nr:PREDICTED: uncharacterized protein LOC108754617 [Trachymyrmex septentrionalis]
MACMLLRKTRSREESSLDNATARKELNPNSGILSDVFPMLRNPRSPGQIQTIQKSFQSMVHEPRSKKQQYQPRDRSKRLVKRLKARSIVGSTYEVDDNDIHEIIHESIPEEDKGPIYIKPVFRVTTKKTIFDSIADILQQLLDPPKKELGPVVGPIKMPGSKRQIYLRLLEPIDSTHVNVRFVTEIPAPVIDEEYREHESFLPYLPFIDPSVTLLKKHPVESSDPIFTSSSNRHHSIQMSRNTSHISDKNREPQPKPVVKSKRPSKNFKDINKENVSPEPVGVEAASGAERDKNHHLYYQYQSGDDAVKHVTEMIKNTTENEQDSIEPWYQLTTHRLPLRQIAPLYPLSAMEHTDFSSYENTYKVPSDSYTSPSHYSSTYEQYSDVNAAPGFYPDQSYTIPPPYSTTYQKQNEFSNAPSSYPISYQSQNEFNNAPSPTSYFKQNDLFSTPTIYTSSHEKPTNVPSLPSSYATTSHEARYDVQTGSSSQDALHVINPPAYLIDSRPVSKNHANKVLEYTAHNGEQLPIEQVTWGKVKREKSEPNFQKSEEIVFDSDREKWQPLMFTSEDTDLQKAVANLAKIASSNHYETITKQQLINAPTPSTIETKRFDQRRNDKRHNPPDAATRNPRCLTSDKGDKCERTESTSVLTPQLETTIKIVQPQSATNIESIMITPKPVASTVETLKSNVVTKSSWVEEPQKLMMTIESFVTNSTTERSPTLIKTIKNTTESIRSETTLSGSMLSNLSKKSRASSTTERLPINGTSEASISKNTTRRRQMRKRPTLMKKPSFVFRGTEANSTTRKSTMSSTTEETKTTRRSKYRSAISNTKSSTT